VQKYQFKMNNSR